MKPAASRGKFIELHSTLSELEYLVFLVRPEREHRLGTINALVYQSFNFGAKVLVPADRTKLFSPSPYSFYFFPPLETTVRLKVPRYTNSTSCRRAGTTAVIHDGRYDERDIYG